MKYKRNVDKVKITCNVGSSASGEFTVYFFRRLSEDGGSWFLQSSIHS